MRHEEFPVLDLHGIEYEDVEDKVEKFVTSYETPVKIVTGHSETMKSIVRKVLLRYGLHDRPERLTNAGCMVISEDKWSI